MNENLRCFDQDISTKLNLTYPNLTSSELLLILANIYFGGKAIYSRVDISLKFILLDKLRHRGTTMLVWLHATQEKVFKLEVLR